MKSIFRFFLNLFPRPLLIRVSYLLRPVFAFFLRGNQFVDPIDGKGYRTFLPYGYGKTRENVLSPGTLSLERHRLLWIFLKEKTSFFDVNKNFKVLHFAPEQAFYSRFKKFKHWNYTTTDLNSPLADVKADICNLPFEANAYDLILCNHVLEHIPDDQKAMHELFRVLKPGGMGIFQIPQDLSRAVTFEDNQITNPKERAAIFGQYDHVRIYGYDFFEQLRNIGFRVEEVNLTIAMTDADIKKFGLAKGEIIPVCYKD